MSTIDIRSETSQPIREIVFADNNSECAYYLSYIHHTQEMYLHSDDTCHPIRVSDIDNLIKALNKAKEIWKE